MVVTAHEIFVDGALRGTRLHTQSAALGYTADAPAARVLEALRDLFADGHAEITVTGPRADTCRVRHAPDAPKRAIVIEGSWVAFGMSAYRPVFRERRDDPALVDRLRDGLTAPFLRKTRASDDRVVLAASPEATGADLRSVLAATCDAFPAISFLDYAEIEASHHQIGTLPLCRKILARDPAQQDALVAAMPTGEQLSLCYSLYEPERGQLGQLRYRFQVTADGRVEQPQVTGLHRDVNACAAWLLAHHRVDLTAPPFGSAGPRNFAGTVECNMRCCNGD